ncbi:MAG: DUF86 domain-containing protein [Comamonas sp.]
MNRPAQRWQAHALHILDAIARIRRIQARGDLTQDEVLYDAALRNLQTLSEATQHLPPAQKAAYPQIPWRDISGFRNILVHNYMGDIDARTVAAVIDTHLPTLERSIRSMLAQESGGAHASTPAA